MNDIILKESNTQSFMGIDKSCPAIVVFVKNKPIVKAKGNEATGKTSWLTDLMYKMGAYFSIDQKTFKNLIDGIDSDLKFEKNGSDYIIEANGGRIALKELIKDKWIPENSPKEAIRKMFGPLGVSPMFLKELPGKKQIQWFKDTFGNDEEATRKEQKLVADIDTLFNNRREVNRSIKAVKGFLDTNELYNNYESSQKKFAKLVSAEKEKNKLNELTQKNNEYIKAKSGLESLKANKKSSEMIITDLEARLKKEKDGLAAIEKRIGEGEQYIKDNKNIAEEYEQANKDFLNISKTLSEQTHWKEVLAKEKEYNELVAASTEADASLDKLRLKLLELNKAYLPKVDGLAVKVKTALTDEEEGIYYHEKTLAMLSESELWGLFADHIWPFHEVKFIFIENINTLGTHAIAILNKLAKDGAMIFATEMDRAKKKREFSMESKIN